MRERACEYVCVCVSVWHKVTTSTALPSCPLHYMEDSGHIQRPQRPSEPHASRTCSNAVPAHAIPRNHQFCPAMTSIVQNDERTHRGRAVYVAAPIDT